MIKDWFLSILYTSFSLSSQSPKEIDEVLRFLLIFAFLLTVKI